MSLFVPEAGFLNVRLSTAEVSLIVTALEEAARLGFGSGYDYAPVSGGPTPGGDSAALTSVKYAGAILGYQVAGT